MAASNGGTTAGANHSLSSLKKYVMNKDRNEQNQEQQGEELKIYSASGSTLQTPEEHQHDQQVDPRKDSTLSVSNDDLRTTDVERQQQQLDGKRGDIGEINDRLSHES